MFTTVAEALAQVDAQGLTRQQAGRDGRTSTATARAAVLEWMNDVARTAKGVVLAGHGQAALRMPKHRADVALLEAARLFLEVGRPHSAEFVELGLSAEWDTALTAAIDAFEKGMRERRGGQSAVTRARGNVKGAMADCFHAIRILDVIVSNSLQDDPALMAAWLRDRRVVEGRPKAEARRSRWSRQLS